MSKKYPVKIGWSQVDITPSRPVALVGQHYIRIASPETDVHDPITATAMAIESENGEHAVFVSVDLIGAYDLGIHLRKTMGGKIPGLDLNKILIFSTHTHTAPYLSDKKGIPDGTMNGTQYREELYKKLEEAITMAWNNRQAASLGWAKGQAAVGYCRIAVFSSGKAKMYGNTSKPWFRHMESGHDHSVELFYTWDQNDKLSGIIINVACPSQTLEHKTIISADYWGEVRKQIRELPQFSNDLKILPMCGAAGDQSPRDLENHTLTKEDTHGYKGTIANGAKITKAVVESLPAAEKERTKELRFAHRIAEFTLPRKPGREKTHPFPVELHAVRIGDVAFVDNPFELYLDYGLDIKRRSPSAQTFIGQLASGPEYGMYLATEKALKGGAYGSGLMNGQVPPAGGKILVDKTVELLNKIYAEDN